MNMKYGQNTAEFWCFNECFMVKSPIHVQDMKRRKFPTDCIVKVRAVHGFIYGKGMQAILGNEE